MYNTLDFYKVITLAGLENTREHNTVDLLAYHEMLGNLVQGFLLLQSRDSEIKVVRMILLRGTI